MLRPQRTMHLYRELLDPCVNSFTYGTNLFHGVKPAAALSAEIEGGSGVSRRAYPKPPRRCTGSCQSGCLGMVSLSNGRSNPRAAISSGCGGAASFEWNGGLGG
jgi:hypothetical protein